MMEAATVYHSRACQARRQFQAGSSDPEYGVAALRHHIALVSAAQRYLDVSLTDGSWQQILTAYYNYWRDAHLV